MASAVEYDNNNIEASVEDSGEDIVGEENFKPGMDVYYKRGDGRIVERRISTVTKKSRRIILHTHANGLNVSTQCFGR